MSSLVLITISTAIYAYLGSVMSSFFELDFSGFRSWPFGHAVNVEYLDDDCRIAIVCRIAQNGCKLGNLIKVESLMMMGKGGDHGHSRTLIGNWSWMRREHDKSIWWIKSERRNANSSPVSWIYTPVTSLNTWLGSKSWPAKNITLNDYWLSFNGPLRREALQSLDTALKGGNRACQSSSTSTTTVWLSNHSCRERLKKV